MQIDKSMYRKDEHGLWRMPKQVGGKEYLYPLLYDEVKDQEFDVCVPELNKHFMIHIPFGPNVKAVHVGEIENYTKCGQCMKSFVYTKNNGVYGISVEFQATKSTGRKRVRLWFRDGQPLKTSSGQGGSSTYNSNKSHQIIWLNIHLDKSLTKAVVK